jgi:hypothetical protein
MWKIISALIDIGLIVYCVYIGAFKADPTIKDIAFIVAMTYINTSINQGKLSRLLKE